MGLNSATSANALRTNLSVEALKVVHGDDDGDDGDAMADAWKMCVRAKPNRVPNVLSAGNAKN